MKTIFKKSIDLESEIDEYLNLVDEAILIFEKEAKKYFGDPNYDFKDHLNEIISIENKADALQKNIKYELYKEMLIPDARADVLSLVKSIDNIVDLCKEIIIDLSVEKPKFPEYMEDDIFELLENTTKCINQIILGANSYFKQNHMVSNYVNKVNFYEHEIDLMVIKLKKDIFNDDNLGCSKRIHLKSFLEKIADISDNAEYIGEKLIIANIKKEV